jgi:hypothetical protein
MTGSAPLEGKGLAGSWGWLVELVGQAQGRTVR